MLSAQRVRQKKAGRLRPGQSNREVENSGVAAVFDGHVWLTLGPFKEKSTNDQQTCLAVFA